MNKYWIHKPSGQKAEIISGGDTIEMAWKGNDTTYQDVSKESLEEFYIPITKAEYDSDITLKEIEASRDKLFDKLVENDKILCKSDCCSLGFTDIEAGDILRVNNTAEDIAILWGLTEGVKNKRLAVTSENINKHFLLYNDEVEKISILNYNKDIKGLQVKCTSYISDCEDIIPDEVFTVKDYSDEGIVTLIRLYDNEECEVTFDNFKKHFIFIEECSNNTPVNTLEVGGNHYQQPIQVWDFVYTDHIPFDEASVIKYICRHKQKNGAEDIEKAISFCKHILKTQYGKEE